ncbi:MAG: Fibronectin type domain protein, partial [Verrucomicrobiales bacterium]|nr:Fibronectin type domain protein [Verrucomicrobiales bacterium]
GVFTGSVATASSPAGPAVLQVAHGDALEVIYNDASPLHTSIAGAIADLQAPIITNVAATNRFAAEVITWNTDEPANSVLVCLTNGTVFGIFNSADLETEHSLLVKRTTPGVTYQFYVVSTDEAGNASTNNNGGKFYTFVAAGVPTVLLVNNYVSTSESADIPVTVYTDALDQTGVSYEVWDEAQNGSPTFDNLRPYRVVVWRINDSFWDFTSITPQEQDAIQKYLNAGGSFFMSSMEILTRLGAVPFRNDVLQVQEFTSSSTGGCTECDEDHSVPSVQGNTFDPVAPGVSVAIDYSAYPSDFIGETIDPDISDTFTASTNAVPFLFEPASGRTVGVRYPRAGQDSHGRIVFLSFPLDGVPMEGEAPNNRSSLLKSILAFLAPGLNGVASIALNNSEYTAPSQITIEVGDSDLTATNPVVVHVFSDSAPAGRDVALQSTPLPGLFRGFLSLTTNTVAAPTELTVKDGDTIVARYHDLSPNNIVQAAALVDLQHPGISNIVVDTTYQEASITWDTTEPTDALVQFGESTFLGRVAYSSAFLTSHEVTLVGLQPDRTYYYQIVSRDLAGNTSVDDNDGKLYTFATPKPLLPPWFDDLEHGSTNWSILDSDQAGSNVNWEYGRPSNALATGGHSGNNVWGVNLHGEQPDEADSFLIGPAILLSGGNRATLRFWQIYDFNPDSVFEFGQLLIVTNSQGSPNSIGSFDGASDGWEQAELDLTPYIGSVIQLVWEYTLFDLDSNPHPGWLIDDVSVTVTNEFAGAIVVSNNIAAAKFTITGPTNYTSSGVKGNFTNAPAGDYVITFGPVPYYTTPPTLTNSLSLSNQIIYWVGVYSFPDANLNGISDLWEQEHFGSVSPTRTRSSDTDGDGMSDYGEFIAGTDPNDSQSRLHISPDVTILPTSAIRLQWNSVQDRIYRVFSSKDGAAWLSFPDLIKGTGGVLSFTVPGDPQQSVRFFKVEVSQ